MAGSLTGCGARVRPEGAAHVHWYLAHLRIIKVEGETIDFDIQTQPSG